MHDVIDNESNNRTDDNNKDSLPCLDTSGPLIYFHLAMP